MNELPALLFVLVFFGLPFMGLILWAWAASRPCGGAPHHWHRHPDYFRSRVCLRCGRCETLGRSWEFDGYDRDAIAKATGSAS